MLADSVDVDLLIRIAWLYYEEGLTQDEIARVFPLSRSKVVRMLKRAKEEGIVSFQIRGIGINCLSLERELISLFNLQDAMVVPIVNEDKVRDSLGKAAAIYLERNLKDGQLLAIGWGRTIHKMANYVSSGKFKNLRVVNLMGGLTTFLSLNPYDIGGKLASTWRGECYYVYAPAIAASEELCRSFKSELTVKKAMEMAKLADYCLVGIGEVGRENTLSQLGYISLPEIEILRKEGAVGNIMAQFFNIKGEKVNCELHRRIVSLSIEELRDMKRVIGVAGGNRKIKSILGALHGRFVNILITDENTAKSIIHLEKELLQEDKL
ncbi:sugar-binding transcriptional regulator [Candidatus Aerophobetes bacterium]|nr:sugar-binding transcriptional regulator [Candidatus Aerophobetes bacterium]